ncbi:hypothetical protein [Granulicella sp. dw_53]|uniref:hypothetical protein n=1 Tax=Granulicella sp. dw_53 TaxID=2719792 RepID=UPI001BD51D43|nr:hypothetical protein [Granulicella sp. dw_53]
MLWTAPTWIRVLPKVCHGFLSGMRTWLLSEMKLRNRQKRLGFVVGLDLQLMQRLPEHCGAKDELDAVEEVTALPCLGGFVVTECYGNLRTTSDFDVLDVAPRSMSVKLMEIAGRGTDLARRHRLYIDIVGVASVPYGYESRLTDLFPDKFERLHLRVMDPTMSHSRN